MMTKDECIEIMEIIGNYGLVYGCEYTSSIDWIEDETFQLLRDQFLESQKRLSDYINICIETHGLCEDEDNKY